MPAISRVQIDDRGSNSGAVQLDSRATIRSGSVKCEETCEQWGGATVVEDSVCKKLRGFALMGIKCRDGRYDERNVSVIGREHS